LDLLRVVGQLCILYTELIERLVEVETEELRDVQQEPADENYFVDVGYSIKVRF